MLKAVSALMGIALCTVLSATAWACNSAAGEVTKIDSRERTLVITHTCSAGSEEMKFTLHDTTKVVINGKAGTLADLRTGDKIKVDYEKLDDVLTIDATHTS